MRKILYITLFSVLAVSAKAQIPINTFFDVSTPNPIDGRFVIATLSDTSTITDLYDGLLTVVQNTDQLWQYDGTKWVQFQTGSSDNIYNTNGTISDNRTVTVGSGNFLNITTQDGDGQIFIQDGIGLQLGGNTSTPGGRETVNFPNVGGGLQYGANYSNRAGFGNRTIPDWGYISEHTVDTLSSLADTTAAANNVGRIVHVVDVDQKWTVNSAGSWEALSGSGGTDDQTAAEVSVTPTGNLNSTDVQAALEEHQSDIDALASGGSDGVATAGVLDVANQEIDLTVASPGSNFSIPLTLLPTLSGFSGWDQDVSDDFDGNYTSLDFTGTTGLSDGIDNEGTDDQTAAEVTYDNADSGLSATNVKDALDELDSDVTANVITAGNGITKVGSAIELGGNLTKNTTIDGGLVYDFTLDRFDDITFGPASFINIESDSIIMGRTGLPSVINLPTTTYNDLNGGRGFNIRADSAISILTPNKLGGATWLGFTVSEIQEQSTINGFVVIDRKGFIKPGFTTLGSAVNTGSIGYNPGSSTLATWDGSQWNDIGSGGSDGVATAGTLDVANEEIDITVNGNTDFSINMSSIENLISFSQFARYTLGQSLVLNNQTLRNGLTTPGISMTDGGALVLPEATGTYSPSSNGELFYDSNQLQYRANGTTRVVNDWDDLLNIPSHLSDGTVTAAESSYSTISSGLSSTTVQDAIDDIAVTPNETTLGAAATTHSVDLGNKQNHIELVSLTSTDTNDQIDLTVTNPKNGGVYTFHFIGADGEEIGWPSNFYYANETQMPQAGSPMTLTASDFFTCYYSSTNSRFYCK